MERVLPGVKCPESWGGGGDGMSLYREGGSPCLVHLTMKNKGTREMTEPGEDEVNLRESGKAILTGYGG